MAADRDGLTVSALSCQRGGRTVFTGLSFTVAPGGLALVRGANGSGKSSLLRILAGLAPAAAGTVTLGGRSVQDSAAHRRRVLYVGHRNAVKPWLSVVENLQFWMAVQGLGGPRPERAAAMDVLDRAGLRPLAHLPGAYLSFGQARRLALARLWAVLAPDAGLRRPLILLDEPAVGLDRDAAGHLDRGLAAAREAGAVLVVAAHGPAMPDATVTVDLTAGSAAA